MLRSSSVTLRFANTGKLAKISEFLSEYRKATMIYIDRYWEVKCQKFPENYELDSPLSVRAKQAAAQQAIAVIAGTKRKFNARAYRINKLFEDGKTSDASRLQKIQDNNPINKPNPSQINPQLDSRFVQIIQNPRTKAFDLSIKLKSLGIYKPFYIPVRKHKHLNKLLAKGSFKTSVVLTNDNLILTIESEVAPIKGAGILGIDIGSKHTISASDGQQTQRDNHGWALNEIQKRLALRRKGSKGFARTQAHRNNFIRWSVNQLNFSNVGEVRMEDLKGMRKGKRLNRFLQGWNYRDIVGVVERKCEERGVRVFKVPRQYTSQRCSECGWVSKDNRKAEAFSCGSCGYVSNADINAARNIALGGAYSPSVPKSESNYRPCQLLNA